MVVRQRAFRFQFPLEKAELGEHFLYRLETFVTVFAQSLLQNGFEFGWNISAIRRIKVVAPLLGWPQCSRLASRRGTAGFLPPFRRAPRPSSKYLSACPPSGRAPVPVTCNALCLILNPVAFAAPPLFRPYDRLTPAFARSAWRSRNRAPSRIRRVAA